MFYYFGAKHSAAARYAPPRYDTIIEPFAGAAGYACYWLAKNPTLSAILVEKDPRIVDAWERILASTPDAILAWTTPTLPGRSDDIIVTGTAGAGPLNQDDHVITSRIVKDFPNIRRRIAWLRGTIGDRITVTQGDYRDAPDIEASWFIDPPYQHQGHQYNLGAEGIDYPALAEWSQTRRGQVIVCEAAPADWLPFRPAYRLTSTANTDNTELVWESDPEPTLWDV